MMKFLGTISLGGLVVDDQRLKSPVGMIIAINKTIVNDDIYTIAFLPPYNIVKFEWYWFRNHPQIEQAMRGKSDC